MTTQLSPLTVQRFVDNNGNALAGGQLYTYQAGTSTPAATYTDSTGVTANTNPVVMNARGEANVWTTGGLAYKFVLKDASGNLIWSVDNITDGSLSSSLAAALASTTDPTKGVALVGGAARVVDSIAALRTLPKTGSPEVFVTGYYTHGDGGGGAYWYDSTDSISADNGGTIIVASDGGRWKLANLSVISVTQFGIIGDGSRDNTAQMAALQTWLAAKHAAGNVVKVIWPAGRYNYTTSPNWAITNLCMEAQGEVWLINNGTGVSFLLDGGATGAGVTNVKITGNFFIYPAAGSQQGAYIRAVHHSFIDLDSRGAGTGYQAIYIAWCVVTEFRLRASSNEGGWYNAPTHGLYLTQRGSGEQVSYCTFINPIIEGAPIGAYLDGALGNTFIGGTMEACTNIGAQLTANALHNKFLSIDFEGNTNYDISCAGAGNEFLSCDTLTKLSIGGGSDNKVINGLHQLVETLAGATRTLLSSFTYNRTSGTAFPSDGGSLTRWRDLTNFGTGAMHNVPPSITTLTVGASPYNYQNNSNNEQDVIIEPGTVQGVSLVRAGNFFGMPTTIGMYRLSPGDSIQVAYTAAPAMYVLSR